MPTATPRSGRALAALAVTLSVTFAQHPWASGQGQEKTHELQSHEFVVESYYRAKWGQSDEFLCLYKKNHLPILNKLKEEGRIIRIEAVKPRYHATEDGRWDYRVVLTFRDAAAAHDPGREEAIKRELYTDQEALQKEEHRRFEILDSHWDVVVDGVNLNTK
jgi:hypothetical protein